MEFDLGVSQNGELSEDCSDVFFGVTALDSGWGNGFGYHKGTEGDRVSVRGVCLRFEAGKMRGRGFVSGRGGF